MFRRCSTFAVLALIMMWAMPAYAQAPGRWTQAGMLRCKLNPSIGFIIAGHQSMECSFQPNGPNPPQAYQGALNTVGLDVGITAGGVLGWAVFAPTSGVPAGALAGEYVGASGDIGLIAGVGTNILAQAETSVLSAVSRPSRAGKAHVHYLTARSSKPAGLFDIGYCSHPSCY
jgi:hypothetical protein